MLSYCLKCRKNRENENPKVERAKYVECVIVKNQNFPKNEKLKGY